MQGWLGRSDFVLHSGEGSIHAMQWQHTTLAWANDLGVKVSSRHARRLRLGRVRGVGPPVAQAPAPAAPPSRPIGTPAAHRGGPPLQVYDTGLHQMVGTVLRNKDGRFADCFDCRLYLHDDNRLFIAWPDCVKVRCRGWGGRGRAPGKGGG